MTSYALEYGWEGWPLEYTTVFSLDQVTLSHNRDIFSGLVSNVQVLALH